VIYPSALPQEATTVATNARIKVFNSFISYKLIAGADVLKGAVKLGVLAGVYAQEKGAVIYKFISL
jgi:hypothetical protein